MIWTWTSFCNKKYYYRIFLCNCERNSLPGLCSRVNTFNMVTHFRFRIWILLLFCWTRKKFNYIMWALNMFNFHFIRNGNKLSFSSSWTTEVQICQNVGLPNTRLPNLVFIDSRLNNPNVFQSPIYWWPERFACMFLIRLLKRLYGMDWFVSEFISYFSILLYRKYLCNHSYLA